MYNLYYFDFPMKFLKIYTPLPLWIIILLMEITKSETSIIEISNPNEKILTFYTSFISKSIEKTDYRDDESFSFTGKICSANNTNQVINNCLTKYENYNYIWV
jgi:hypothetical protein